MFYIKQTEVWCPVGDHVYLGKIMKGRMCAFICDECQFKHIWDEEGKLIKSEKIVPKHIAKCGCGICKR